MPTSNSARRKRSLAPYLTLMSEDARSAIMHRAKSSTACASSALSHSHRAVQRERSDAEYGVAAIGRCRVRLPAYRVRGGCGPDPVGREEPACLSKRADVSFDGAGTPVLSWIRTT